jgi:hypothetical protein
VKRQLRGEGRYDDRDTDHFTVTRSFLTRAEQMLDVLLDRPPAPS